ncbi:MAG: MBL fold metallo-hydrolase [Gemmatimonadota bacterium]|nr:MBL fold metallo-hydrolase [Gemmatimonadota bacterium]MDE3173614.1 MBL fold metallo-hydrolase [Gemmatimonadota bacterium]MDE3217576.1 MBL fold metallo-hydrolase [Gemmatimonadota bacterium]
MRSETVGPFQENCYLVVDPDARRAVLVDPGDEPERLLAMIARAGVPLDAIWLTHAHLDHVGAINAVRRVHPVPVWLHPADRPLYDRAAEVAAMYGLPFDQPEPPDRELAEGDRLTVGGLRFDVLHTPGHAPGHVVFLGHGLMLGGDLLFRGSVGRTDLPFSSGADMDASLARLGGLAPDTIVHPGHGPATTIGEELATNPFLNGTALPVRR